MTGKESPCYTNSLSLFILLSSEKNEPRSAAAVIGLLARRYGRRRGLRNSLRSNSPRPFPSVSLVTSPPDKGGIGDCALACILTPSVLLTPPSLRATSPIFLLRKTKGESVIPGLLLPMFFSTPLFFQPLRPSATSPIFCCAKHRGGVLNILPIVEYKSLF